MKAKRIQLRRTKGWKMPPNTVKVTRPGKWGNPFKVGEVWIDTDGAKLPIVSSDDAVDMFRSYVNHIMIHTPEKLAELRGKNLACFCALDKPCHADVLLELANA